MIRKLQKLKAKRGFTILELIVVLGIIAIMVASVLVGSNNRRDRIKEANSAAADFYSAIQTEFMRFQMFDGALTLTLSDKYATAPNDLATQKAYQGVKYYPAAGGNYPFVPTDAPLNSAAHLSEMPKGGDLYIEAYVVSGSLKHVDIANTAAELFAQTGGSNKTEVGAVLLQEMKSRMEFKDGYYYAKVTYTPPTIADASQPLTVSDYKSVPVKVEWAAYTSKEVTANEATQKFKTQNMLEAGRACGVCLAAEHSDAYAGLGGAGTTLLGSLTAPDTSLPTT